MGQVWISTPFADEKWFLFTAQMMQMLWKAVIFQTLQEVARVVREVDLWAERVMADRNCGVQMMKPLCLHFSRVLFYQQEAWLNNRSLSREITT